MGGLVSRRASGESRLLRVLDLSCSQHVLFGLEIHKSFDCFSLPDMSFQSDSFRAIPPPGFVIYISTIVWSPDFEERGNRFYPVWPHRSSPEIKENIQPLSKKFTSATCVIFTHISFSKLYLPPPSQIPLNLSSSLKGEEGGRGEMIFLCVVSTKWCFSKSPPSRLKKWRIFFCFCPV